VRSRLVRVVGDPFPIRGKPRLVFVVWRVRNRDRLSLTKELEDGERAGADRTLLGMSADRPFRSAQAQTGALGRQDMCLSEGQ